MKRELRLFLTAVMFLTRLPVSRWVDHHPDYLQRSARYFPLVGWIVALGHFAVFAASHLAGLKEVAVLLAMGGTLLITGAFHEDGFADCCDAFGGGWSKDQILTIMKDSRLGTFGVAGLFFVLLLKFYLLVALLDTGLSLFHYAVLLVLAHAFSRFVSVGLIQSSQYVVQEGSKAKPLASERLRAGAFGMAALFGLLPLIVLPPLCALVVLPAAALLWWARRYFTRWIGGYTGDCLGALQQVTELVCYLTIVLLWKYT